MKNVLYLFLLVFTITANAQSELLPSEEFGIRDCYNCVTGKKNVTGVKLGIGYGVVKEINENFDLFAHLSYNFWRHGDLSVGNWGYVTYIQKNHLANLSVGERFHFFNKNGSSFFTGLNMNFQVYFNSVYRTVGLSVEPNLGWRKLIGKNHEFFTSIGYDKHLTSYQQDTKIHPGKVSMNIGFNVKLGNRKPQDFTE